MWVGGRCGVVEVCRRWGRGEGWGSTACRMARFTAASIEWPSLKIAMARSASKGLGFFGFGDMRGFSGGKGEGVAVGGGQRRGYERGWREVGVT